ncbi:MAG: universal stress protein [Sphingobacteriales bacterium]
MMKNILVLTDFSEVADNAAEYAVKLAAASRGHLILFHAIKVPDASSVAPVTEHGGHKVDQVAEALAKLEITAKKLRNVLQVEPDFHLKISLFTQTGNFDNFIEKFVADHHIDLIIMGARQSNDFPGFLFGNNIRGVVDAAPCPILLIHHRVSYRPVKHIFYVTDLRYCDLNTLAVLTKFAAPLKSHISLLHAGSDGLPALLNKEAAAIFRDTIVSNINYGQLNYYDNHRMDAQAAIGEVIEKKGMDILATAHKKYHFFNHLFRKNLERNIAVFTQIPILIVPGN